LICIKNLAELLFEPRSFASPASLPAAMQHPMVAGDIRTKPNLRAAPAPAPHDQQDDCRHGAEGCYARAMKLFANATSCEHDQEAQDRIAK